MVCKHTALCTTLGSSCPGVTRMSRILRAMMAAKGRNSTVTSEIQIHLLSQDTSVAQTVESGANVKETNVASRNLSSLMKLANLLPHPSK